MHSMPVSPAPFTLPLIWTVGFSGKRFPAEEEKATEAIRAALDFLREKAVEQGAALSAVSSLARGGDMLFATICAERTATAEPLPWKCLLPFAAPAFLDFDLETDAAGMALPEDLCTARRTAFEERLPKAEGAVEVVCPGINPHVQEQRVAAYLECGYRTVDESDVMIVLLAGPEFERMSGSKSPGGGASDRFKGGSLAVARYATSARHPTILLNADAEHPWAERKIFNEPDDRCWFYDAAVTPVVRKALRLNLTPDEGAMPPGPQTPARERVWEFMRRLGGLANQHQRQAHHGFQWMLSLHLAATAIAALGATALGYSHADLLALPLPAFVALLALASTKPLLAGWAWLLEHSLHKSHTREDWLSARVLAELCRGALSVWPLPLQPMDAMDEEDFPRVKRLIRTLRLMRAEDPQAAVRGTARIVPEGRPWDGETQLEADMREATHFYIAGRLRDQSQKYYQKKLSKHRRQEKFWSRLLVGALLATIVLGVALVGHKIEGRRHPHHSPEGHPWANPWKWAEAGVIIAPFVASFALGMGTVADCRRRIRRYPEMQRFLDRLADTLKECAANPSRLRLIEQAERMMIEEQHEWFSTTRNFSV